MNAADSGGHRLSNNAGDVSLNFLLDGVSIVCGRDASFCALIGNTAEGGTRMRSVLFIVIIVSLLVRDD